MKILLLVGLIVLNGLFAMSEIALVAAKNSRLKRLAKKHRSAQVALELKENPTRFLSTIQIGITVIGLLSGIVGEATLSAPLAVQLELWEFDPAQANILSTAIVVVGITYFAIVVGELVPKRFAQSQAENIAVLVALPIFWLSKIATPFVFALSASTEGILKLMGRGGEEDSVTEDDIHALVKEGSESGVIERGEQEMIRNILQLDDRLVSSLMTPRRDVDFLDIDQPVEQLLKKLRLSKHSVFPLCQDHLNQVVGTVSAKALLNQAGNLSIQVIMGLSKSPIYVPESMKALRLLSYFKGSGAEMVFIVDEYGDVQGLVTHYDILEAIAGELSNNPQDLWTEEVEDGLLVDGLIPLSELKNRLELSELEVEKEGFQTLNGLISWLIGRLPEVGEVVEYQQWQFEITSVENNRIVSVKATPITNDFSDASR
ncbi:hemolysin family protein [Vibrio cyclitrophicus]|uniref:hemolysin family protein n=1 Tax=Vibrio cyclitrophicus TaxID=47951 RepID=UPI0002EB6492|nr:hemolysin family protein [Vibrio cyclitrophicus]OEE83720.1 hemolysin [Vibrio cyclitrophicus FF160]PME93296.1 hemolysin [Vibrio cyclitrophicus]PMF62733.1 hemolysin [Vibrio cyclitrophicus]PMG81229.1 hemolysin [Vibrio cyclitrophicus]PMJ20443.1 hemolysin [Vibrio cyclitrophicus]